MKSQPLLKSAAMLPLGRKESLGKLRQVSELLLIGVNCELLLPQVQELSQAVLHVRVRNILAPEVSLEIGPGDLCVCPIPALHCLPPILCRASEREDSAL